MTEEAANELVAKIEAHKAAGGALYVLTENDEECPRFYAHKEYSAEVENSHGEYYKVFVNLSLCQAFWRRDRYGCERLSRGVEMWGEPESFGVYFTEAEMFEGFREVMAAQIKRLADQLKHYDNPALVDWDTKSAESVTD